MLNIGQLPGIKPSCFPEMKNRFFISLFFKQRMSQMRVRSSVIRHESECLFVMFNPLVELPQLTECISQIGKARCVVRSKANGLSKMNDRLGLPLKT